MNGSATRARWAWIALALYLSTAFVPLRGLVLCIAPDGHISLEGATAQASCVDCPSEIALADNCCSDTTSEQPSSCRCSDVLILAGCSKPAKSEVAELVLSYAPELFSRMAELDVAAWTARRLSVCAPSPALPPPRAATNPILRV